MILVNCDKISKHQQSQQSALFFFLMIMMIVEFEYSKSGRREIFPKNEVWVLILILIYYFAIINLYSLMVKLAPKGAQDPVDPSLQMKVFLFLSLRSDNTLSLDASSPPKKTPIPKSMPSDSSQETKSLPRPSSGTTWVDNSKPKELKVKFLPSTRSLKEDPIMSKPLESSWDISQELTITTCTKSTEMSLSMEQLVNSTLRWQETTELHLTPSLSSRPQFSTRKTKSEDQDQSNTETQTSNSQFWELLQEPATGDTEPSLKPTAPTPSTNDRDRLFKSLSFIFTHLQKRSSIEKNQYNCWW